MTTRTRWIAALLLVSAWWQLPVPARAGFVNDYAQAVDGASALTMQRVAARVHAATGGEIVVVTVRSNRRLQPGMAERFVAGWQLWSRDDANPPPSILLVLAVQEGDLRISASPSVGDFLGEAVLSDLLQRRVVPHLQEGRVGRALLTFVEDVALLYDRRFGQRR